MGSPARPPVGSPWPPVLRPPPRLIAHRGGSRLWPENTLAAFRGAAALGADMVELDVHRSRDGVPVVIHDPTLDRTTDRVGPVAALTAAELAQVDAGARFTRDGGRTHPFRGRGIGVPTLAEALAVDPTLRFNIEIKPHDPALVDGVVAVVRAAQAETRVMVGSARGATHRLVAAAAPDLPRFFSGDDLLALARAVWTGRLARYDRADPVQRAVQPPLRHRGVPVITRRFVRAAHDVGCQVHVWTVNREPTMERLLDRGVDGILSDRPDLLERVLRRRGLR